MRQVLIYVIISQWLCFSAIINGYSLSTKNFPLLASQKDNVKKSFAPGETNLSSYLIYKPKSKTSVKNLWDEMCPSWSVIGKSTSLDVVITWTRSTEDAAHQAASELIGQMNPSPEKEIILIDELTKSLIEFSDFCKEHIDKGQQKYKARIVASRGKMGTKCPQWHIDHVPVRWIQSLKGPGCEIVLENGINWSAINGLEDDDSLLEIKDRNDLRVDSKLATIYRAKEQEVALLVGNKWNDFAKQSSTPLDPAVHRSPSEIPPWQGRILLTQDILLGETLEDGF